MKKGIGLCLCCLAPMAPIAAMAQEAGEVSVYGGYVHSWNKSANQGWEASIAGNISIHFALVADFAGSYRTMQYSGLFQSEDKYRNSSFLFGPRYLHTVQNRWTPFAHALFGMERNISEGRLTSGSTLSSYGRYGSNTFAVAIGGGMDIPLNDRVSVRAIQLDAVGVEDSGGWGYYLRASLGMAFHLGGTSQRTH